jgi:electron transport complex protein RnfB
MNPPSPGNRRKFLVNLLRAAGVLALGATVGRLVTRATPGSRRWQLDPSKCVQCGGCATACVLKPSAVRCVHAPAICGYCNLCMGFFGPQPLALNTGAENQQCPTGAIQRKFVEDPFFEYTIDETRCIGCARCVKGCTSFGNGSLFLQVHHQYCLNCNECFIAKQCPGHAYVRVPAEQPYLLKKRKVEA